MPKKRQFHFKPLQSTASASHSKSDSHDSSPSVNERLSELRRLEGKDAAARRRQLAESVNQRSVPPDAQRILGVSESAPPKPRKDVNARARERLRGAAGPAPPRSWTKGGGGVGGAGWGGSLAFRVKGGNGMAKANQFVRNRPKEVLRFARLTATLDERAVDGKPSKLSHLALKTTASLWDEFDEQDYPALADIPLRTRLRLLSYIVFYGPPINPSALQALLQGSEGAYQLDLAGLIGYRGLTLRKIQKFLEQDQDVGTQTNEETVLDSWDADDSLEAAIQPPPPGRFSQLAHLSLSHPNPKGASWKDLLSLTKHTPQVTHLSLAYWPRPTLTPNLSTATVSTPTRQEVSAGGSNYYSTLDSDMEEPASLIRQLSGNLLCLEWLDLEGCSDWLPALLRLAAELAPENQFAHDRRVRWMDNGERWKIDPPKWFSIFISNWKNLSYVRCAQPETPTLRGLNALLEDSSFAASNMERKLCTKLRAHLREDVLALAQDVDAPREVVEVQKRRAMIWLQQERKAVETALRINDVRKMHGTKMVVFDHGWMQTQTSYAASGY